MMTKKLMALLLALGFGMTVNAANTGDKPSEMPKPGLTDAETGDKDAEPAGAKAATDATEKVEAETVELEHESQTVSKWSMPSKSAFGKGSLALLGTASGVAAVLHFHFKSQASKAQKAADSLVHRMHLSANPTEDNAKVSALQAKADRLKKFAKYFLIGSIAGGSATVLAGGVWAGVNYFGGKAADQQEDAQPEATKEETETPEGDTEA